MKTAFSIYAPALLALTLLAPTTLFAQETDVSLGTTLPLQDRAMQSSNGSTQRLADLGGPNGLVLIFWSNNCPWVDKYEDRLRSTVAEFSGQGFGFVLVNSNDPVAFPEESIDGIRDRAASRNYGVPYLLDEGSALANALGVTRTPHVYVFDGSRALIYSGTLDDSPGDPGNVKEAYLNDVLAAVGAGGRAPVTRTTAFGCRLKPVQ